jgi:Uma2 family endonuclease
MAAQSQVAISAEEYLARERSGEWKHEYHDGEVVAMVGASEAHNLIAGNAFAGLHAQLRGRPCRVYPSDLRVRVSQAGLYTYPDLTVVCGPAQFADDHRDTLLNPTVIVEVLSPSTEGYDRGRKFQQYRTLESLREYLLIAQDARHVEHFVRQGDHQWLLSEASAPDAVLHLPSIGCALSLADLYEKVALDED